MRNLLCLGEPRRETKSLGPRLGHTKKGQLKKAKKHSFQGARGPERPNAGPIKRWSRGMALKDKRKRVSKEKMEKVGNKKGGR